MKVLIQMQEKIVKSILESDNKTKNVIIVERSQYNACFYLYYHENLLNTKEKLWRNIICNNIIIGKNNYIFYMNGTIDTYTGFLSGKLNYEYILNVKNSMYKFYNEKNISYVLI